MGKTVEVKDEAGLAAALKNAPGPIVIDFVSKSCDACEADEPDLKKLAKSCADVTVVKIDVDAASVLADKWGVQGTPSLFIAQSAAEARPGAAKEVDWASDAAKLLKKCMR